jgi:hypothetical protein
MLRDAMKWTTVSARYAPSRMVLSNDRGPYEGRGLKERKQVKPGLLSVLVAEVVSLFISMVSLNAA